MFINYRFSAVAKTVAKMFVAVFFSTFLAKKKNRKRKRKIEKVDVDKETFYSIDASFYIVILSEFVASLYMIYSANKAFKAEEFDNYVSIFNSAFFGWGALLLTMLSIMLSVVYTMAIINSRDLDFFNSYYYYIPVIISSISISILRLFTFSLLMKFYPIALELLYLKLNTNGVLEFFDVADMGRQLPWIIIISLIFGNLFFNFIVRSICFYFIKEHLLEPFSCI